MIREKFCTTAGGVNEAVWQPYALLTVCVNGGGGGLKPLVMKFGRPY